jgi:acetyl-CoA carboxylase carboxyl transferase subunit beta
MSWFQRQKKGILTNVREQNDVPEGQWIKCTNCSEILNRRELEENRLVCPKCSHHFNMSSLEYFQMLFDDGTFETFDENLFSVDALRFEDRKSYPNRLKDAVRKTGLNDAARAAVGSVGGHRISAASLDFDFIGGSMGSVVGEIVTRSIRRACDERLPLLVISQSGGARMMEGALSLMQMAKTSANLTRLADLGLPYISLMTNPTTGGVTASFAMLGDFNIAEPGALIGFAGPRVIRETIGQDLPPGFQKAEFLKQQGFLDFIVDRRNLRPRLIHLLDLVMEKNFARGA